MSKEIRFYVICGQYESVCYGGTSTLRVPKAGAVSLEV